MSDDELREDDGSTQPVEVEPPEPSLTVVTATNNGVTVNVEPVDG